MRTISVILIAMLYVTFFFSYTSIAGEKASEDYVYALKIEGGDIYRVTHQTGVEKEDTVKEEIRRMEIISPGTIIEIGKGVSVSLTCTGCNIVKKTHDDSPYTVNMADFKKEGSIIDKATECFTKAIKEFIYPDSKPGEKKHMAVRTSEGVKCVDSWPMDNADILPIGDSITLGWKSEERSFSIEIKELYSQAVVYSGETSSNKIIIPFNKFKQGRTYTWLLTEKDTGNRCNADFTLLSNDESVEILNTLSEITTLLPFEADNETRCRLQAGYLSSIDLKYSAWQWLGLKKIAQNVP